MKGKRKIRVKEMSGNDAIVYNREDFFGSMCPSARKKEGKN